MEEAGWRMGENSKTALVAFLEVNIYKLYSIEIPVQQGMVHWQNISSAPLLCRFPA